MCGRITSIRSSVEMTRITRVRHARADTSTRSSNSTRAQRHSNANKNTSHAIKTSTHTRTQATSDVTAHHPHQIISINNSSLQNNLFQPASTLSKSSQPTVDTITTLNHSSDFDFNPTTLLQHSQQPFQNQTNVTSNQHNIEHSFTGIYNGGFNLAPSAQINIIRNKHSPFPLPTMPLISSNPHSTLPQLSNTATLITPTVSTNTTSDHINTFNHETTEFESSEQYNSSLLLDTAIWGLNSLPPAWNFSTSTSTHQLNSGAFAINSLHNIRTDNPRLIYADYLIPCVIVLDGFVEWKDMSVSTHNNKLPLSFQGSEGYLQEHCPINSLSLSNQLLNPKQLSKLTLSHNSPLDHSDQSIEPYLHLSSIQFQSLPLSAKKIIYQHLLAKNQPSIALDSELLPGKRIKKPYFLHSAIRLCSTCQLRCELPHVPRSSNWPYCQCSTDDIGITQKNNNEANTSIPIHIDLQTHISPTDNIKQHDLLYCAGVYNVHIDEMGKQKITSGIITTAANPQMNWLHDRMPFVLSPFQIDQWLQHPIPNSADIANPNINQHIKQQTISPANFHPTPLQQHKAAFLQEYLVPFYAIPTLLPTSQPPTEPASILEQHFSIHPQYALLNWYPISSKISKIQNGTLIDTPNVLVHFQQYKSIERTRNLGRFFPLLQHQPKSEEKDDDNEITICVPSSSSSSLLHASSSSSLSITTQLPNLSTIACTHSPTTTIPQSNFDFDKDDDPSFFAPSMNKIQGVNSTPSKVKSKGIFLQNSHTAAKNQPILAIFSNTPLKRKHNYTSSSSPFLTTPPSQPALCNANTNPSSQELRSFLSTMTSDFGAQHHIHTSNEHCNDDDHDDIIIIQATKKQPKSFSVPVKKLSASSSFVSLLDSD